MVAEVGASLSNLYLTANAKKTRVLSLKEAKKYFHLETNAKLDDLEKLTQARARPRRAFSEETIQNLALRTPKQG
jgi:hypothetical protein